MENELQFDQVQRPAGASACASCHGALLGSYFQANGQVLCENCATGIRKFFQSSEGGFGRVLKATAFGIGGGLAGGAVYAAVLALAHVQLSLLTILIGWLVGKGVRKGSGGRGGLGYQIVAVAITYFMIGVAYVVSESLTGEEGMGGLFQTVFAILFGGIAGPVFVAIHSPISGLITAIGLYQAWKMNTPLGINITGPHALAPVSQTPVSPPSPPETFVPPVLPAPQPLPPPSA